MRILVYTRTTGYRHESIPAGIAVFQAFDEFSVEATEDPARFHDLRGLAAVVFMSTSGDVFDPAGRAELCRFTEAGGGFLGVHAAACTEYGWPFYGDLVGARFDGHPEPQKAAIDVCDRTHPAMSHLPERWIHHDEWYNFQAPPGPEMTVLATVDEQTYTGGTMGAHHPLVWCRDREDGGRSFYTALGHATETYADPDFRAHLHGALTWVSEATR